MGEGDPAGRSLFWVAVDHGNQRITLWHVADLPSGRFSSNTIYDAWLRRRSYGWRELLGLHIAGPEHGPAIKTKKKPKSRFGLKNKKKEKAKFKGINVGPLCQAHFGTLPGSQWFLGLSLSTFYFYFYFYFDFLTLKAIFGSNITSFSFKKIFFIFYYRS